MKKGPIILTVIIFIAFCTLVYLQNWIGAMIFGLSIYAADGYSMYMHYKLEVLCLDHTRSFKLRE